MKRFAARSFRKRQKNRGDGEMKIEENEVYTTKEVAAILKISLPTVKRMLKDKRLPSTRIGKQHRFLGKDLLAILETRQDLRRPPEEAAQPMEAPAAYAAPAAVPVSDKPRIGEPEYVKSLTSIERRQRTYMLGKEVLKDIYAEDGTLIVHKGTVVNDDVIIAARSYRKMTDLFTSLEHEG